MPALPPSQAKLSQLLFSSAAHKRERSAHIPCKLRAMLNAACARTDTHLPHADAHGLCKCVHVDIVIKFELRALSHAPTCEKHIPVRTSASAPPNTSAFLVLEDPIAATWWDPWGANHFAERPFSFFPQALWAIQRSHSYDATVTGSARASIALVPNGIDPPIGTAQRKRGSRECHHAVVGIQHRFSVYAQAYQVQMPPQTPTLVPIFQSITFQGFDSPGWSLLHSRAYSCLLVPSLCGLAVVHSNILRRMS